MELVITGSESFIGQALARRCRQLAIGFTGVDAAAQAPGALRIDIRDPGLGAALPRADALVHLAAVSRDADCRRDPANALSVNVAGTWNVIEAARAAQIQRIVFASSEWVYAGCPGAGPFTEDTVIDINRVGGEYALTKLAGERLLAMAAAGRGLSAASLRFGIVYGPRAGNWSAVESLFDACRSGETVRAGSLATARCFVHVDDVADAILAACRPAPDYRVYNVGGAPVTLGEIVEASTRIHGARPRIEERDAGRPSVRLMDSGRAARELGWTAGIPLERGLRSLLPPAEAAA